MPNAENEGVADVVFDDAALDVIFSAFRDLDRLVLAVSGGPDSIALMVMCRAWQRRFAPSLELFVASVDHGLRPEAAQECAFVRSVAGELGLAHDILHWRGDKSGANLQARAREVRYRLLSAYAHSVSCSHIAVAHHLDDQAETFMMRLLRGSGVGGLSAMQSQHRLEGMTIHRPLLDVPKSKLRDVVVTSGYGSVDDPSNLNDDFLRVRVRSLLPQLAEEGCDAARLAATARRMQRAEQALDHVTQSLFNASMQAEPGRALSFDRAWYCTLEEEFRLRLLRLSLAHVAGDRYPPREGRLLMIDHWLMADIGSKTAHGKRTCHHCCFETANSRVWIYREMGREMDMCQLSKGDVTDWLGIYSIRLLDLPTNGGRDNIVDEAVTLRPLGADGKAYLAKCGYRFSERSDSDSPIPSSLVEALPSLWTENRPQAVVDWPEIGIYSGFRVDFEEKNTKFIN